MCVNCWYEVACVRGAAAAVWRSRVEIVWHIHHRGDSVSEGGSQAGGRKRRERERELERRQEKKNREKEGGE